MKYLLFSLVFLCASCSNANEIDAKGIDLELQQAISFGPIQDLNEHSDEVDKQLFIRLFRAPLYVQDCFLETNGICKYKYFLSVSSFDEQPETNIYSLKAVGEIADISWSATDKIDTAIINLTINKYTSAALKNNKELKSELKNINLVITPKNIIESEAQ